MTTARRPRWSQSANRMLMARKINNYPGETPAAPHRPALTCKSVAGAGDENRTRTISLGS